MGRVAVDFGVGQGAKRSADIRSDLGQASNAGQCQNQRNRRRRERPIPIFQQAPGRLLRATRNNFIPGRLRKAQSCSRSEHKIRRSRQAQPRPQIIKLDRLIHIEDRKRSKDRQRDDLLQHFQLPQTQRGETYPVRRHLKQILEQRDPPAQQSRYIPFLVVPISQMRIPGKGHERVRTDQ